jgi:hypothetical protein
MKAICQRILVWGIRDMQRAIINPGENGYWVAECPSLPGSIARGTSEEAMAISKKLFMHMLQP